MNVVAWQHRTFNKYEVDSRTGCWLWQGSTDFYGYGVVRRDGETWRTHRLYYEWYVGPIPKDLWILHKCDVPHCVNPKHLYAGTALDNSRDKREKNRSKHYGHSGKGLMRAFYW